MKEIKFRVYDKQSNEIIYLEPPSTHGNGLWFKSDKHIDSEDIVIMQYTGLKDCEGKEVFEGDIIQDINDNNSLRYGEDNNLTPVKFYNGSFGISVIFDGSFVPLYPYEEVGFKFKVVGNIHQNSELLEKKSK